MLVLWEPLPPFLDITLLWLRINPELSLKSSNPSIYTSFLCIGIDALLFAQLTDLHLLLFHHGIPDCLGVLLTLHLSHEGHYFRPHQLISGLCNMDRLHS